MQWTLRRLARFDQEPPARNLELSLATDHAHVWVARGYAADRKRTGVFKVSLTTGQVEESLSIHEAWPHHHLHGLCCFGDQVALGLTPVRAQVAMPRLRDWWMSAWLRVIPHRGVAQPLMRLMNSLSVRAIKPVGESLLVLMDLCTGKAVQHLELPPGVHPLIHSITQHEGRLYAAVCEYPDSPLGFIAVYRRDSETGQFQLLQSMGTPFSDPCLRSEEPVCGLRCAPPVLHGVSQT